MAVFKNEEDMAERGGAYGASCFYCYKPIKSPDQGVCWQGAHTLREQAAFTVFLHARCCMDMTIRLFRDLHELQVGNDRLAYACRPDHKMRSVQQVDSSVVDAFLASLEECADVARPCLGPNSNACVCSKCVPSIKDSLDAIRRGKAPPGNSRR